MIFRRVLSRLLRLSACAVIRRALLAFIAILQVGCSLPLGKFFEPRTRMALLPTSLGLSYLPISEMAPDGSTLRGWWIPATTTPVGTVLFFHGKEGNISYYLPSVYWLPEQGFNVFMLEYEGYPLGDRSRAEADASPSVDSIAASADLAFKALRDDVRFGKFPVVVYGQSLGGSLAVYSLARLAPTAPVRALIIDGSFGEYSTVASESLQRDGLAGPVSESLSALFTDTYDPLKWINKIGSIPVLVVHSEDDEIVPVHHAVDIYNAAHEPKFLWLLRRIAHTRSFVDDPSRAALVNFMRTALDLAPEARAGGWPTEKGLLPTSSLRGSAVLEEVNYHQTRDGSGEEAACPAERSDQFQALLTSAFLDQGFTFERSAGAHVKFVGATTLQMDGSGDVTANIAIHVRVKNARGEEFYPGRYHQYLRCHLASFPGGLCGCIAQAQRLALDDVLADTALLELIARYRSAS